MSTKNNFFKLPKFSIGSSGSSCFTNTVCERAIQTENFDTVCERPIQTEKHLEKYQIEDHSSPPRSVHYIHSEESQKMSQEDQLMFDIMNEKFIPKHEKYSNYITRLQTFKNWPLQMTQFPSEMAQAGFYYDNISDSTTCFWCGISIFKWLPYESAVGEHKRLGNECKFLSMNFIV